MLLEAFSVNGTNYFSKTTVNLLIKILMRTSLRPEEKAGVLFSADFDRRKKNPMVYIKCTNVIYGIHCVHCGLVYVGATGRSLRSRMNGHGSAIKKGGQSLLHRHFHQPDHSVDDMRVQILEKVYHSSENPTLLTSLRRTRELFWIKELGTAKPYGFNDQIKGVGTLSSISCKKTNIYSLFNKQPRRKRSHGKRHYNKRTPQPDATTSTLVDLVDMIEKPEGVHNINTKLFSISFPQLRSLQKLALESTNFDYSSAEYRVIAIILDIANYRLFRPVRSDVPAEKPKHFLKIKFLNKAVDAINLPALLRSTSVTDKIPVYFRDKEPPIVSYEYTSCHMNTLALLPANYLTLHQSFQI